MSSANSHRSHKYGVYEGATQVPILIIRGFKYVTYMAREDGPPRNEPNRPTLAEQPAVFSIPCSYG